MCCTLTLYGGDANATPDALIAATALTHRVPLMTRNRRHFEKVPQLRLVAPA